jgi:hypothetical protein
MPYGKCPICGSTYHLGVTDHPQWYKDRGLEFGAILNEKCLGCFRDLKRGDRVRILRVVGDTVGLKIGDKGFIKEILETDKSGKRYVVEAEEPSPGCQLRASFDRDAITWSPRGKQPIDAARNALSKRQLFLFFREPSRAFCAIGTTKIENINVYDLYEKYAEWKLSPEQFADEIEKRIRNNG